MALYAARIGAHSAQIKALGIIAVKYRIATPANQCLWHVASPAAATAAAAASYRMNSV